MELVARPRISLIAAVSRNGVIGRDGGLPWNIPEDLKHFKTTTMGCPIILGRKTYQSIGRLLPGRKNIIITRQTSLVIAGAVLVSSLAAALQEASIPAPGAPEVKEIFVIGGGEIYAQALPFADRLHITEIEKTIQGDAWFPEWPKLRAQGIRSGDRIIRFKETACEEHTDAVPPYRFLILDRA